MSISIKDLDESWYEFLKLDEKKSFLKYLLEKYEYNFNTVIELSDDSTYKMIRCRLIIRDEELKERRKVVDMWDILNWSHPYFMNNKELNFTHPTYLIEPKMVDNDGIRNDNEFKNVNLVYWFEVLIPYNPDPEHQCNQIHYGGKENVPKVAFMYDSDLDGSGKTYEEAIENLFKLVCDKFGYPQES